MNRRAILKTAPCAVLLAGCLEDGNDGAGDDGESDDGGNDGDGNGGYSDYRIVARPSDTMPPEELRTSIDDPKIEGPIEEAAIEAIETNEVVTRQLKKEEKETTLDQMDELPTYESDDGFSDERYVTRNDDVAVLFTERDDSV